MSKAHEHGGNVFAVARSLGIPPEGLLDFSASINPLGMAPGVKEAVCASLDRFLHYPDKECRDLSERLASYHGVAVEEVVIANGSTELIHLLPRLIPGKRALVIAPAFAEYANSLKRAGWGVDYLVLDREGGFRLSLAQLENRLKQGYDLLFLCNPSNPTGSLVGRVEIEEILRRCEAYGTFLVLDEAFIDFCEEESAKESVIGSGRGVVLRSMTKFFALAGLRLGYALAAAPLAHGLKALQDPWCVNSAAQVAGVASLDDPGYRERTRSLVICERERLAAWLDRTGWIRSYPSKANYLLGEILDGESARGLMERLLREGVLIRDCANFTGLDDRFFRVAVRLREENERLLGLLAAGKG